MRCPRCGRATYPRVRNKAKAAAQEPREGAIKASLADGTCFRCYAPTMRCSTDGKRVRVTRYVEPFDVDKSAQSLLRYFQARQHRGVDPEGKDPATLVKPGLFLMEVP